MNRRPQKEISARVAIPQRILLLGCFLATLSLAGLVCGKVLNGNAESSAAHTDPMTREDLWRTAPTNWTDSHMGVALRVLEEKLLRWESQPADDVVRVIDAVGDAKLELGRSYLVRFLRVDPALQRGEHVIRRAALALGELGGADALNPLLELAGSCSPDVLPSVVVALGLLEDPRAVSPLERLSADDDATVRRRAISALARYCAPTSRSLAVSHLREEIDEVRNSAYWWLATCANAQDEGLLVEGLADSVSLVRVNCLKGLIRLESEAACGSLSELLNDENLSVQETARAYHVVCRSFQAEP